jgi:GH24 family phage-related lysozyme (muramidase)
LDEPLPDPDSKPKPADLDYIDLKPLRISKAAVAHIVHFETGGRSYYEAQYQRPQWPGYSSGVTIGFGYDLGYTSKDQIRADWTGRVDPSELDAMLKVQGVTGSSAKFLASEIRNQVRISWEKAQGVFEQSTLPRWSKATSEAYVLGRSELPPDCNGALIGNTFNRGTAMSPEGKQREKWLIREAIRLRNWSAIPALLREQRKHWPNTSGPNGLQTRRSQEAELFEKGLQAMKDGTFPPLSYLQEDRSSGTGRSYGRNDVVGPRHPIWRTEEIHPALIARKNRILGIGRDGEHRDTIRAGTLYAASAAAYAAEQIGYHLFVTSGNRWGVSSSPNHGQNKDLGDAIDFVITDKPDGSGKTLEGTDGKRQTYEILAAAAVAAARDKTKPGVGVGWGRTNGAGHHIEVDDSQRGTPDAADVWPYSDSGDSAFLVFERDWASGKILADDKYAFYWDYFHGKPADTAGAQ